jgi:DNA-binding CsgD family transcriptional regulator
MYLSARQTGILTRTLDHLTRDFASGEIRRLVGLDLLDLLGADYFASYVWDAERGIFADRIALNMDPANLARYEAYYQFHDPITYKLQQRREPTLVVQVMPQEALVRTEFFNDFLGRDGLYWGVNLYAYDGSRNIGDLRIWRRRGRGNFDRNTLDVLEIIKPVFTNALRHALPERASGNRMPGATAAIPGVTAREEQVAALVAQGLSDKQIADRLHMAFSTVRTHVKSVFAKLGVHNRASLCRVLLTRRSEKAPSGPAA